MRLCPIFRRGGSSAASSKPIPAMTLVCACRAKAGCCMANPPNGPGAAVGSMLGHFDPHLTQLIIDEETSSSITSVLRQLIRDSQATSGMVLDRAGQIIVWDGIGYENARMQLGALIAGTYASTRE